MNRAETNYYKYTQSNYNSRLEDTALLMNKRVLDVVFSLFGLIVSLPIILITMIIIRLESKGSPIFLQERTGLNGKTFNVIKLRSMSKDAESNGPQWASKNDCRVTRVGKFIRKTRIDELPQFINVLKGEMSLVGPRPERPIFIEEFQKEIPNFTDRLLVKPGLTGWAQINGGYEISAKEKLHLDLEYIQNISVWTDVKILFGTIKVVLTGDGAR